MIPREEEGRPKVVTSSSIYTYEGGEGWYIEGDDVDFGVAPQNDFVD